MLNNIFEQFSVFYIRIIIEKSKKLVFFPMGYAIDEMGQKIETTDVAIPPANEMIFLELPYDTTKIMRAIEDVFLQTGKYERWSYRKTKLPWEAKYYKLRSFKAAMKDKQEIGIFSLNYDNGAASQIGVMFSWPCKSGYQLYGLEYEEFLKTSSVSVIAESILKMTEKDFCKTEEYFMAKSFLL